MWRSTIRKIAARFSIGDGGTIEKFTKRVFHAVKKIKQKHLKWPDTQERTKITAETNHELSGCVGYLDATEIKLCDAPVISPESYFSRKHHYSVKLQGICDYTGKLRYVTIGYPGSVHDSRIFRECAFSNNINHFLSNMEFIAADSAYQLSSHVITPYRRNSREVSRDRLVRFNKYFSRYRVRIEHVFGKLKEIFSSLKELRFRLHNKKNYIFMCDWILVCCILHNVVFSDNIENEDNLDDGSSDAEGDFETEGFSNDVVGELRRQILFETCVMINEP